MESISKTYKVYAPLNLAVTVAVQGVALSQLVNQYEQTIEPLRSADTPTIIRPVVDASTGTKDPSWVDGNVAARLQEVKWLANGVDISVPGTAVYDAFHLAGSALYEIVQSNDDNNGSLRLWKNLAAEEAYTMQMEAKLLDSRTGRFYNILTDGTDITAQALGDSEWDFSIVHDVNIKYSPVLDRLKLYDWLVANKKITASNSERSKYLDATAYLVRLPILVTHGHFKAESTERVTFRLFDHLHDHVEIKLGNNFFLKELDKEHLLIDQRFLPDENYVIDVKMYVDGEFQSQEQLTFSRYYPRIEVFNTNNADIDLAESKRWDKAIVTIDGMPMDYPEAYIRLAWYARAIGATEWVYQGYGETVEIRTSELNIQANNGLDGMETKIQWHIKSGLAPLSNGDDSIITDNNGAIIVDDTLRKD